ncbi:MAG: glycosyltransferase family 39 protein [Leptolyngbyaceae cyanobacterium bins.59]|nr:glycosyltransferase family 39 protein [Leptolyngbyaceae cyanobacterium bins.59]
MELWQKWFSQKENRTVFWLLAGGLLLRGMIALWLYPGFDEAYYYLYTVYPNLSYFDHPPLVALTTGLGIGLTGVVSQFTIRLGPLLLYTGTLVLLYLTAIRLFSRRAAVLTLAIVTFVPFFLVGVGTLTVPDGPLMFGWTATLYVAAIEFFQKTPEGESEPYRPTYRLAIISVLVGIACLGKYHGFLLGAGLVGFCLTSPRCRAAFRSPWLLLGFVLFLMTISPMLIWNAQHHWASFTFQSSRSIPDRGYRLLDLLATFLGHVAYLFPTFGFAIWWVTGLSIRTQVARLFSRETIVEPLLLEKQALILWVSLPIMLGFTLMGGYRQVLPSWPMPGFWGMTLLLGERAVRWQMGAPKTMRRWWQGSAIVVVTILTIALSHVALGTVQKPSQYAIWSVWPPKEDPSTQLIDVEQLRQGFVKSPELKAALDQATFVVTNRFFVGGQVAMALIPISNKPVTVFNEDPRGFAFWEDSADWLGKDGLYVTSQLFQEGEDVMQTYSPYFESLQKIGEVPILRGGATIVIFDVYSAKKLQKPYAYPAGLLK